MYILLSQPLYPNLLLPAKEETAVLLTPNNSFAIISHSPTLSVATSPVATCATPTFSPAEDEVAYNTNVEISCATQGATIHYITDGSTPTTESCSVPMVVV